MGHKKLVNTNPSVDYPDYLKKISSGSSDESNGPIVVNMSDKNSEENLKSLIDSNKVVKVIDNYGEQYAELLLSKNAHLYAANYSVQVSSISKELDTHYGKNPGWMLGSWVYLPWNYQLIHLLDEESFIELRTIRNKDLITIKEQQNLRNFNALCFGMSVGSAGALALAISGISQNIKLVDGAVISGSNLNRIMTGVESIGTSKANVIGRKIYEMNPYSQVVRHDKVSAQNIAGIFDSNHKTHVVIDEIDDIEMKVLIRLEARKRRIPVVMATELADSVMLDIERYDLEPDRPIFHGIIPGIDAMATEKIENRREWMKRAVNIIGPKNMPLKMQESLLKIGSTIVTHPQLGSTVMITGGMIAAAVKYIALNMDIQSGRYVISLENKLLRDHNSIKHKRKLKKHTKIIKSAISAM